MNYCHHRLRMESESSLPKIFQSNHLITAKHSLTLNEQRLYFLAGSCINPINNDSHASETVTITAEMWAGLFGGIKNAYRDISTAADRLMEQPSIKFTAGPDANLKQVQWVSETEYMQGEGAVKLTIPPTMKMHLITDFIDGGFTVTHLLDIAKFRSAYTIRLYQFMKRHYNENTSTGVFWITVEDLRARLEIGERTYDRFADFKRRIIDPAVKEINKKSEYEASWKPKKKIGRKIITLEFKITKTAKD